MDERGIIVCAESVDDVLELQIWTKGAAPRLVILNKVKNTRKLSPLSWLEGEDRKLSLRGGDGKALSYSMKALEEPVRGLLYQYAQDPLFKGLLWRTVLLLSDLVHKPRSVYDKNELALLPEGKRSALWLADFTEGEGRFHPFFRLSEEEREVFGEGLSLPIEEEKGTAGLKKSGITRKLAAALPSRWYDPLRTSAASILLGFSLFYEEGEDLSAFLWKTAQGSLPSRGAFPSPPADTGISIFIARLTGYLRHWAAAGQISLETALDAFESLKERGFTRKRRMEFPVGTLGDVEYQVTQYLNEEDLLAFGCVPRQQTGRHKGERIFTMPREVYEEALIDDSFGGGEDDYFTLTALTQARLFHDWLRRIDRFADPFLNPGG